MGSMNIYNYYQMALPSVANTKYDSHNKNELKARYKDMVNLNRSKPFYLVSLSNETRNYVLGVKEAAIELQNSSSFLTEDSDPDSKKMMVDSDQPDKMSVSFLSDDYDSMPQEFTLDVDQLATTQKNEGTEVPSSSALITPGSHFFNIEKDGSEYQFEIDTKQGESNLHIQRRLAASINNNNVGITARVMENGNMTRLQLESKESGVGDLDFGLQFQVYDADNSGMVKYFGLNEVTTMPENAQFRINDIEQESSSNYISINNGVGVELTQTTDETATIKVGADNTSLMSDLDDFVDSYNHLIDLANNIEDNPNGSSRLLREIGSVTKKFRNDLQESGITITDDGHLEKNEEILTQSTENGQFQKLFQQLSDFKGAISNATEKITLNPMEYVDQKVVSYPNTKQNFSNPYMPSMYSGMLYNSYV